MVDREHRRIVVKIGSGVLTTNTVHEALQVDRNTLYALAKDMADARRGGTQIILVSSGATALGMEELSLQHKPDCAADVKALASIGQGRLMALWRDAFARVGVRVAQVLLTYSDLAVRERAMEIKATLNTLLEWDVIPVINENDAVTIDEISLGDNDRLSAQVSKLIDASQLLILSSVDGVLDDAGSVLRQITNEADIQRWIRPERSSTGRGGMLSKLESAFAAVAGGVSVVIASGRRSRVVVDATDGKSVGTALPASTSKALSARQHWIAYSLRCRGQLHVDQGAVDALLRHGASLLPVGMVDVVGDFSAHQSVQIIAPDGRVVASGLASRSSNVLRAECGERGNPAVHRDDLVIHPNEREMELTDT